MTISENIAAFKRLLTQGDDLGQARDAFYQMTESPGFFDKGSAVQDSELQAVVQYSAQQVLQQNALLLSLSMVRIAEEGFVHGNFLYGEVNVTFAYLDEDKAGLLILDNRTTNHHRLARFVG